MKSCKNNKEWKPKKLSPCYICKKSNGRLHKILTDYDSYGHISFGVDNYNLCYLCYESLQNTIFKETPIEYLVSDKYHEECQRVVTIYDEADRWTRAELNHFKYYIDEREIRHCNRVMNGIASCLQAPYNFLTYRTDLFSDIISRELQCSVIATVRLLHKENSYLKYLPSEIVEIIIAYLKNDKK